MSYNASSMKSKKSQSEHPVKLIIYTITLLASFVYIIYRAIFTLPFRLGMLNLAFGMLVFIVELIECFEFFVYYWNILRYKKTSPKIPEAKKSDFPEVDVFIATVNEGEKLLAKTLKACSEMRYPDQKKVHIYLCDDGNRKKLRKLAKKYGAGYISRSNNDYAKAGNYNNALKQTESPLVAIFDADMRPKKNFLMKTVPFFVAEEKVGFVQTPQSFRNPDIFQARLGGQMPFEQDYFYHYIQLARNHTNSTILCGTNCVISREALKSAGGFAWATIAEDVATGMLMEAKGYRGIAIADVLAHGEAVDDLSGFLKQRSRWGRGCIQTAKAYGIFTVRGLNIRQKFDYFVAINYWVFGLRRMLYLILPLLFAFFDIIAIKGDLITFIVVFFAQYLLKRFVVDWLEGSHKSSTWTKIYELVQAPYLAVAVFKELIGLSSKKFVVTAKGKSKKKNTWIDVIMFAVHMALLCANGLGIAYVVLRSQALGLRLFAIPLVWMAVNMFYLLLAIIFDLSPSRRHRSDFKPNQFEKYSWRAFAGIFRGK